MPKKIKEEEQQIDLNKPVKKETFATRWFKSFAADNPTELLQAANLTARAAEDQFKMYMVSGHNEVYSLIFYATFMSILKFLKSRQKSYNDFTIQICNSINIGYMNSVNDDDEKVGNFMPIIEHIGINRSVVDESSDNNGFMENNSDITDTISKKYIKWKQLNSKKNVEYYKDIQEDAFNTLNNVYHTNIRTSEAIIPLFCIYMDNIINVLKMKYNESRGTDVSEVSINVFGLFDIYYSYNEEEDKEHIDCMPSVAFKLATKSDEMASR